MSLHDHEPCPRCYDQAAEHAQMLAALEADLELFESWRLGIFAKLGIVWLESPPAIEATHAAIQAAKS